MNIGNVIITVLKFLSRLLDIKDTSDSRKKKEEHDREVEDIQDDPAMWINNRYSSKERNRKNEDNNKDHTQ